MTIISFGELPGRDATFRALRSAIQRRHGGQLFDRILGVWANATTASDAHRASRDEMLRLLAMVDGAASGQGPLIQELYRLLHDDSAYDVSGTTDDFIEFGANRLTTAGEKVRNTAGAQTQFITLANRGANDPVYANVKRLVLTRDAGGYRTAFAQLAASADPAARFFKTLLDGQAPGIVNRVEGAGNEPSVDVAALDVVSPMTQAVINGVFPPATPARPSTPARPAQPNQPAQPAPPARPGQPSPIAPAPPPDDGMPYDPGQQPSAGGGGAPVGRFERLRRIKRFLTEAANALGITEESLIVFIRMMISIIRTSKAETDGADPKEATYDQLVVGTNEVALLEAIMTMDTESGFGSRFVMRSRAEDGSEFALGPEGRG